MPIVPCSMLNLKSFAKMFLHGQGAKKVPLSHLLSSGNRKIPKSTAIFNLSSATDCPSARLGKCKAKKQGAKCYALKAEQNHYSRFVLPYRRSQERFWFQTSAKEFVSQFVLLNSIRRIPYNSIRFDESGDFHGQYDVTKMEEIAKMLRRFGIRCYCYTSRNDLNFSKIRHLLLNGSDFYKKGITNTFKILKDVRKRKKGWSVCPMNCRICHKCQMHHLKIVIKQH